MPGSVRAVLLSTLWYPCKISDFDTVGQCHRVVYDDGSWEFISLGGEMVLYESLAKDATGSVGDADYGGDDISNIVVRKRSRHAMAPSAADEVTVDAVSIDKTAKKQRIDEEESKGELVHKQVKDIMSDGSSSRRRSH